MLQSVTHCEGCGRQITDELESVVLMPDALWVGAHRSLLKEPLENDVWARCWCDVDCFALWMMAAFRE